MEKPKIQEIFNLFQYWLVSIGVNPVLGILLSAGFLTLIFIWAFSFSRSCKKLLISSIVLLIWPVAIYYAFKEPDVKIQLVRVGIDNAAYDTVALIRNNRKLASLPRNAKVYLGFMEKEKIVRAKAQNLNILRINPFDVEKFSFSYPIKGISFAMLIVEDATLKNGISIDQDHIAYTWNEWKPEFQNGIKRNDGWAWWPENSANTKSDNPRLVRLLEDVNACLDKHAKDRNYSACFGGDI